MMRALGTLVSVLTLFVAASAAAGPPTEQVRGSVDRVLQILSDPELKKPTGTADRRAAIRTVAAEIFDFAEISQRSLARHWAARTPAERQEFVQLFRDLLEHSYITKIEAYSGEKIQYAGEVPDGDQAVVKTRIVTKTGVEIPVDYRMFLKGDRWRAYDVNIEGVSLVSNYRTQFNTVIQRNGYADLVTQAQGQAGRAAGFPRGERAPGPGHRFPPRAANAVTAARLGSSWPVRTRHPAPRRKTRRNDAARAVEAPLRPAGHEARPGRWRHLALILSPERVVLVLGLAFGLPLVFLTPPFQVPDEPSHFYRAFQISELRPLSLVSLNRGYRLGTLLPKSLAALVDASDVANVRFQVHRKVDPAKVLAARDIPLSPHDRAYLPVLPYPPPAYLPQAVGIGLGRLFGGSPLVLFYLARVFALGAWLALVFLAVRTTPVLKWTYVLLALMPMTLYLAASTSADSIVIAASFLLSAQLLSWAYDATKDRISRADIASVIGVAVVVALSKALYLPVLLLFFLVSWKKFETRTRYVLTFCVIVTVSLGAYFGWSQLTRWAVEPGPTMDLSRHVVDGSYAPGASALRQLAFIRSNPWAFVSAVATTVSAPKVLFYYLNSFVGMLGWLDVLLPTWLPFAYLAVLIVVSLASGSPAAVGWTDKALALGVFAVTAVAGMLFMYLIYSTVGMSVVVGFQGRYLIPGVPAAFLVFHNHWTRWRIGNVATVALVAFMVTTISIAGYRLVDRFYVGEVPSYAIEAAAVPPGTGVMIVTGWAVDRATRAVAERIEVEIDGRYYPARYGVERSDIVRRLGPSYRFAGFEAQIPLTEVERGRHTVALRITGKGERSYVIPEPKVILNFK